VGEAVVEMAWQIEYLIKQWSIAFSTEHRESVERSSIIRHKNEKEKEKEKEECYYRAHY
jgi:hypothetical protein